MIISRFSLFLTILFFIALCLNVLYFLLSLCLWTLNIENDFFYPVIGALIPIMLLINMISLLHSSYYKRNLAIFNKFIESEKIKIAIYVSMGLINPMLLYLHSKSFSIFVRIWGILRCFPIVNIFLYRRLARKLRLKGISINKIITLYFKGLLIFNIIREN